MTARILIVDDVPANTRLLEAKLNAEYYHVATSSDGATALLTARTWQPDLILLDVMMPDMDGYDTCRRLKADAATLHIPVVMVTALGDPTERLRGLEAGADDFLTKPVEYDTLLARMRSLVRLKRMLDELRLRAATVHRLGLAADAAAVPGVAGTRVLVIDDWAAGARAVQQAVALEGVQGWRATNEAEAMALTESVAFDLIVLSLAMAAEDPLRLAARLRAAEATREVPLLLIAEPEQRARLLRGFDLGANDWIVRPLDENELRVRARNQIRRKIYQDRLRAALGEALELALTDPLTGLYNQRYLMRHLDSLLGAAQPPGVGVLLLDVDHFKSVNDRFGHAAGDAALRQIARLLRTRTRVFDSVARYGGEEFVIVMPAATAEEVSLAAHRLREAIEAMPFLPGSGAPLTLTVSIGAACTDRADVSPEEILQAADRAMYRAKREGRNRVTIAEAPATAS